MKKIDFFLVSLILFISAKSNIIAQSYYIVLLAFCLSFAILVYRNITLDNYFIYFSCFYFTFSLFYFFIFNYVDFLYIFYYFILLSYAYLTIKILKYNFFIIYHDIVYFLALISLPLFLAQLLNLDLVFKIIGFFQHNISFLSYNNDNFANNIFFTVDKLGATIRNSGFAWEPKGFANFLILALIINTNIYKFTFNKKSMVIIIALFTTFSTVGYFVLCSAFIFYVFANNKVNKIYSFVFVFFALLVLFLGNNFILEKIRYEIFDVNTQIDKVYDKRFFEKRSLGRFGSLVIDYNDFIKHPITGYGIQRRDAKMKQLRTQSKYNYTKLVRVNGFSDRLASFGIVGIIFYIISIYKGFKKYLNFYNNKGAFFILLIFIMIEFATNLLTDPFWMIFLFLFLIKPIKNNQINYTTKVI